MIFRRPTLQLIAKTIMAWSLIALLVACGDPKAQTPAIAVTFDLQNYPIPADLDIGYSIPIAAIVTNDPKNAGVTFSCSPNSPAGECGTFFPTGGGSDVPACYLAPDAIPAQNPVTVTATSVTDPTKSVSAMITIVNGPGNPCP
jgi:hypothetical protein